MTDIYPHGPTHLFEYLNGNLYWKIAPSSFVKAGQLAGRKGTRGYWQVKINGKMYSLHHLIWWIHHGYKPRYIDHIDGNPENNRIENLRLCTLSENQANAKISKANTSGYKNIFWNKKRKKWTVRINGKMIGHLHSLDEARSLAVFTRKELNGDFARDL